MTGLLLNQAAVHDLLLDVGMGPKNDAGINNGSSVPLLQANRLFGKSYRVKEKP